MILDTHRFLMFFLIQSLTMKQARRDYWFSGAPSDLQLEERLRHISGLVHLLLAQSEISPDEIQDLVWSVSEYCHRELEIPARIDIRHHLAQAARTEPTLHVLKRYYRDHFFHALEVCFLGHLLLETRLNGSDPLWKQVAEIIHKDTKEDVLQLWYLASLLHDVGYGIDLLKATRRLLQFFSNSEPLKIFAEALQSDLEDLSVDLSTSDFTSLNSKDKPGEDHGIIAASHLKALIKKVAKDDKYVDAAEYEAAVQAVAKHNHRAKEKVSFNREPISFLLIICDTVQEWDRPRLTYETAPYTMLSWLQQGGNAWQNLWGPLKSLQLNIEPSGPGTPFEFKVVNNGPLTIKLDFGDEINTNDALFYTWLDATCNLQRVDLTGFGRDIEIEYINPLASIKGQNERQFYRLRDAARETHMGFIERWFPVREQAGIVTNGAVSYWLDGSIDSKNSREHVKLHLEELSKQKPITKNIDEFSKYLRRWRCYDDNRVFAGDYALPSKPS